MLQHRDSLEGAPVAPDEFEQYDSYNIDPYYARKFTAFWAAGVGAFVVFYFPYLWRSIKTGRIWQGWAVYERKIRGYSHLDDNLSPEEKISSRKAQATMRARRPSPTFAFLKGALDYIVLRTLPHTGIDLGQVFALSMYLLTLLLCVTIQAPLQSNANRAGFLSLAQLPFIFIFGLKASPVTFLLGRGYEKLNFIHRWAGRMLLLTATVHGSLWIRNRIKSGQADRFRTQNKEKEGLAAYTLLCLIVLASLRPVRRVAYNFFFTFHVVGIAGFFIVVCYHTEHASPWIYPPIAFYAFDLLVRVTRMRIKDAYLEAPDTEMTLIHVPDASGGWIAGQHVKLRVFFEGRLLESHPLSILNAPPSISSLKTTSLKEGGMILAARAAGDWSKAINILARSELPEDCGQLMTHYVDEDPDMMELGTLSAATDSSRVAIAERRVSVMIDGPYGGSSIDFASCENVLMIAGGSGITFTLGILDDLVGRIRLARSGSGNAPRQDMINTRHITFIWCLRSKGHISWFSRYFQKIGQVASDTSLDILVRFRFYITCPCDPAAIPNIPNMTILESKPDISQCLSDFLVDDHLVSPIGGSGVGVVASGPERLTTDTRNAVAKIGPSLARRVGGIELHTEAYTL
ncbi:hypothetical protein FRC02_005670 [Tulasnella sp. 418]|nr:hypothetical protein FRC02_005670 [Tulasnella sp. 418]